MLEEIKRLRGTPEQPRRLDKMDRAYRAYLRERFAGGRGFAFILQQGRRALASGTASPLGPWPPTASLHHAYEVLYVYGVYTVKSHRGQGLAGRIMKAIGAEARKRGLPLLALYASDAGKSVYERGGFASKPNWMIKES